MNFAFEEDAALTSALGLFLNLGRISEKSILSKVLISISSKSSRMLSRSSSDSLFVHSSLDADSSSSNVTTRFFFFFFLKKF
jgi:hypothetical protein